MHGDHYRHARRRQIIQKIQSMKMHHINGKSRKRFLQNFAIAMPDSLLHLLIQNSRYSGAGY